MSFKRNITIAVIGLGFIGTSALTAWAGTGHSSDACQDNWPTSNPTTTEKSFADGRVAYELTDPGQSKTWGTVCVSDTPYGTPSSLWGGHVHARVDRSNPSATELRVVCVGDPSGAVTTNCNVVGTVTLADPNPTSPGGTASATATPGAAVSQTGVEAGEPNASGGSRPTVSVSKTCLWVNGSTPGVVATCNAKALEMKIATGDVSVGTTPVCVVSGASGCTHSVPAPKVITGADTANSTVDGSVAGLPVTRDIGSGCVGVC